MPWFAAHAVMYLKCLDGAQNTYVTWENVYLVEAPEGSQVWDLASDRALREACSPDDPSLLHGEPQMMCWGRPARWVFAGIRKVVDVCALSPDDTLASGDELTYSQFSFSSETEILAFAGGADMAVRYDDQLSLPPGQPHF